jgi:hypothetical protein|nr:MAG TPA: hypothetical protein [Caudoviricetes sp.]
MTKQEIIDRINNIDKQALTNAVYTIESANPVTVLTQNNVWVEWSGLYGTRHAHIAPKSRATRENLLAVYYAVLDEIVCQDGLEAIRGIDAEYVPEWWEDADIYTRINNNLNARDDRSAWEKGVTTYAFDLVEELKERAEYEGRNPEPGKECREWMLNGAQDWSQYSWGGSSLIYNADIAERLCCPSELKKTRGGERRPNSREEWLDTQARALNQAARLVSGIYSRILMDGGCR